MTVFMKNNQKKVLPFPEPPEGPANAPIVVQIGNERFAIHYEIEDLPPVAPLLLFPSWLKRGELFRRSLQKKPVPPVSAGVTTFGHNPPILRSRMPPQFAL
jgi:hypothetical protein